jgi:uncharacterized membrane protein
VLWRREFRIVAATPLSSVAKKNVEEIAQVEQELHGRITSAEKIGDWIAKFFGSLWFVAAHAAFFACWIMINFQFIPAIPVFDPYPFPFLDLLVSIEFILLTTFVLMNQGVQARRQEHWGHLNLQLCLLTEQEVTKSMQLLKAMSQRLGVTECMSDQEIAELAEVTPVATLVEEIEKARDAKSPA